MKKFFIILLILLLLGSGYFLYNLNNTNIQLKEQISSLQGELSGLTLQISELQNSQLITGTTEEVVPELNTIVPFLIAELDIELLIPQSLHKYITYEISNEGQSAHLILTNYRDNIPQSLIPTYQQLKDYYITQGYQRASSYTQEEHQTMLESSKRCSVGRVNIQKPPLAQVFEQGILAENLQKQVLFASNHEPCDPYHFFPTTLDTYNIYISPLLEEFMNILHNTNGGSVIIK